MKGYPQLFCAHLMHFMQNNVPSYHRSTQQARRMLCCPEMPAYSFVVDDDVNQMQHLAHRSYLEVDEEPLVDQ